MTSNAPYNLPAPNEDFNHPDSYMDLSEVRSTTGTPIHCDTFWKPSPGHVMRPQVWDAGLLSRILLTSDPVIEALGVLQKAGWPVLGMGKLRSEVQKVCGTLIQRMLDDECERIEKYLMPDFCYCNATHEFYTFQWKVCTPENWEYELEIPVQHETKIKLSLDRTMPMIVSWCCCTFFYCREMWGFDKTEPLLDIVAAPEDTNTLTEANDVKPKKLTVREKFEQDLAAMNPQERIEAIRQDRIRRANQRKLSEMLRKNPKLKDLMELHFPE